MQHHHVVNTPIKDSQDVEYILNIHDVRILDIHDIMHIITFLDLTMGLGSMPWALSPRARGPMPWIGSISGPMGPLA